MKLKTGSSWKEIHLIRLPASSDIGHKSYSPEGSGISFRIWFPGYPYEGIQEKNFVSSHKHYRDWSKKIKEHKKNLKINHVWLKKIYQPRAFDFLMENERVETEIDNKMEWKIVQIFVHFLFIWIK